ncbi:hypothetical protein ASE01_19530 [Nocardioides sp. Root190]|uniref:hypothetical protein n=1 Tax=Nocardioides sp. Root190 TaxID=1736488 RepID=UPI0007010F3A|nr:hypothetical protein [Nocardioides sp. Root190]KRB74164.1 hypothetical protein ASE01_19530 [Nocardioides sp. Root190]
MAKNATHDLAHDLRDVADDLKELVETVVVPKVTAAAAEGRGRMAVASDAVGSAVQAAAGRVPDNVVDRLPNAVSDRLPTQKPRRGRKLLLVGLVAALAAGAAAFARKSSASAPEPVRSAPEPASDAVTPFDHPTP